MAHSDAPLAGYADIERSPYFVDKTGFVSSLTYFQVTYNFLRTLTAG